MVGKSAGQNKCEDRRWLVVRLCGHKDLLAVDLTRSSKNSWEAEETLPARPRELLLISLQIKIFGKCGKFAACKWWWLEVLSGAGASIKTEIKCWPSQSELGHATPTALTNKPQLISKSQSFVFFNYIQYWIYANFWICILDKNCDWSEQEETIQLSNSSCFQSQPSACCTSTFKVRKQETGGRRWRK